MSNAPLTTSKQKKDVMDRIAKAAHKGAKIALNKFGKRLDKPAFQRMQADEKLTSSVAELVEELIAKSIEFKTSHLTCISFGKNIVIDETDGTETIAQAKDVFPSYIDSDFKNWNLDVPSAPTKKTKTQVFEMIKDGTFAQIFGSFGENLDRLCLTQGQIKVFCRDHADWLRTDGYGTFFLFKVGNEYFVAGVSRGSGGLGVDVDRLSDDGVWDAEFQRRLVVPQL